MQSLAQLEYEYNGLSYTFTLTCDCQKEEMIINVIRKEEYAEWESIILSDQFTSIPDVDTVQVNYSPYAKYRIINDYVSNQLDDMHNVIFPDVVNANQITNIMIRSSPKYGKRTYIIIPIYPKDLSEVEILTKNLSFQKESTAKQLDALQNRISELEKRLCQIEPVNNNKRISLFGVGIL